MKDLPSEDSYHLRLAAYKAADDAIQTSVDCVAQVHDLGLSTSIDANIIMLKAIYWVLVSIYWRLTAGSTGS